MYISLPFQFIKWLSKLRKQYGKVFRIFTGNRAYVVLMDKVVGGESHTRFRSCLYTRAVCLQYCMHGAPAEVELNVGEAACIGLGNWWRAAG